MSKIFHAGYGLIIVVLIAGYSLKPKPSTKDIVSKLKESFQADAGEGNIINFVGLCECKKGIIFFGTKQGFVTNHVFNTPEDWTYFTNYHKIRI